MKNYTTIAEMREDALEILRKKPGFLQRIRGKTQAGLDTYLEEGAGTGQTVRNNERAFEETEVVPQFLTPEQERKDKIRYREIPGVRLVNDIFIAPTAGHGLFHPNGEAATLEAAVRYNTMMIVSSLSQTSWIDLIGANGGRRLQNIWHQMFPLKMVNMIHKSIEEAEESGCSGIVLTIDAPKGCSINGSQKKLEHARSLDLSPLPKGQYEVIKRMTSLPVYFKGIMTPEDAEEAKKMGTAGIYVSNHGGRQYDRGMSTLEAVRRIRDKIGGDFPLIMDGGIRTGQDVVIARRAGADLVGIGRPIHYGLTVGGEEGVGKVFEILRAERGEALSLGM